MKRLIAVISGLLVLPAFAEVAPEYFYQEMMAQYAAENPDMEYITDDVVESDNASEQSEQPVQQQTVTPVVPTAVSPRNATGRAAASRAVATSTTTSARNVANRNNAATMARTVTSRPTATSTTTTSRTATTTASRAAASRTNASRTSRATASNTVASRPTTTVRSTTVASTTPGVTTRAASAQKNNSNTARASIVQTDTVNTPLYISGGTSARISTRSTNVSARVPTIRVGSTTSTGESETSVSSSSISMDELAQLTDYCKAQYTACMDNFCNVLDENQGRCSCSANLDSYAETEAALKQATEDLQDVAQQIQYIGLTAEEVETLFSQTEAELQMQSTTDNSQLKNDLDKIKNMIVDVQSGRASTSSSGLSFDLSGLLDFTIDSTGFDLTSLLGGGANTNSISNQRGEKLYDTAASRCKAAVLNSCQAQGVDITIITNAYDLEIDKACIAYERALTESNDQMSSTVRNAKSVLQRARLLVAQQKNQYDLRGCVTELDNCMQDDFVCGDDYENCLDPSGKYIVNGEIVVGSEPGAPGDVTAPIYNAWRYTKEDSGEKVKYDAWGLSDKDNAVEAGNLSEYIAATVTPDSAQTTSSDMSKFLQNKIGYHDNDDGKNYGMCMSVLNRCQDITYTESGNSAEYNPQNNVVKEFLNRTLVQIKSAQDAIMAEYAEDCITDVASCLAQNNYDPDDKSTTEGGADEESIKNKIAIRACNPIITTCMSVNKVTAEGSNTELMQYDWIKNIMQ